MKKSFIFLSLFLFSVIALNGCGNSIDYKDVVHDPAKMEKLKTDIKEKVDDGKVFLSVMINPDGDIGFSRQNEKDPLKVESFRFSQQKNEWNGPTLMTVKAFINGQAITAQDISSRSWSVDSIDFKAVAKAVKDAEALAKEKGFSDIKIYTVEFSNQHIFIRLKSNKGSHEYEANPDGTFKEFSI